MAKQETPSPTPFEKFQSLAQRLVSVPREELEREQAKYEKKRKKSPKQSDRKPML